MIIKTTGTETIRKVNFINVEFVNEDCDYLYLILTNGRRDISKEQFPQAHVIIDQLLKLYDSKD